MTTTTRPPRTIWLAESPAHRRRRNQLLWTQYRLTADEYDAELKRIDHQCGVCGIEEQRLRVNRDKWTLRLRGLTCHRCALALAKAERLGQTLTTGQTAFVAAAGPWPDRFARR